MKREQSIVALIKRSKEQYLSLQKDYEKSLKAKEISEEMKIDIKNIFENLRSVLDYLAKDIAEKNCPNITLKYRLYFPIRQNQADFQGFLKKSYPGLDINNSKLCAYLESIQIYKNPNNEWLSQFNKLNNDNKHDDLVEQTRKEARQIEVSRSGGSVAWGPGVTFGKGVSVMGVPIDSNTQLPVANNLVKTEIITWVDFKFRALDKSVLTFIQKVIDGIENIFAQIKGII